MPATNFGKKNVRPHSVVITPPSTLDSEKEIAKIIFEYVELADKGQLSKKQLDKVAKPLQKQLDSMRVLLGSYEVVELDRYRTQLVSEMVDRRVAREKK